MVGSDTVQQQRVGRKFSDLFVINVNLTELLFGLDDWLDKLVEFSTATGFRSFSSFGKA